MGPVSFRKLVEHFGGPEEVFSASSDQIVRETGVRRDLAGSIERAGGRLPETAETLEIFESCGVHVLYPDSPDVPGRLLATTEHWHCLMLLGDPSLFEASPIIGMVGSRHATAEGLQFAHDLAAEIGRRGIPTLSGMAQGIDRGSHLGSFSESAPTIGVLPMGILRFLRENRRWPGLSATRDDGSLLLVSGAPPNQIWSVAEAMRRNFWIASWCDALVVVEAGEKGGTWKTASSAARLGRPLWVATGFSEEGTGVGNRALLAKLKGKALPVGEPIEVLADRVLASSKKI